MKIIGIEILSKEDIELRAEIVIEKWFPNVFQKPTPFPLMEFCKKMEAEYKIRVELNANLGFLDNGDKVWGCFQLNPRTIFIDRQIRHDVRFPFILAHEIGHLILHRKVEFNSELYNNTIIDSKSLFYRKEELASDYDWMEWQANTFAASILMPRKTFPTAVMLAQKLIGINRIGKIYIKAARNSEIDYNKTIQQLSFIYKVSKESISYRLNDLDLLEYESSGPRGASHIYEILRSNHFL